MTELTTTASDQVQTSDKNRHKRRVRINPEKSEEQLFIVTDAERDSPPIDSERRRSIVQSQAKKQAISVDTRGPSRQLNSAELRRLRTVLQDTPEQVGYPTTTWTPKLVRHHLHDDFGVTYSTRYIDHLTKALGVSHHIERSEA